MLFSEKILRKTEICKESDKKEGGIIPIMKQEVTPHTISEREQGVFMEINAKSADRKLLLELKGELDHHGARNTLREIELAIDASLPKLLVLDLAGVSFMDSSGIALILRAQQRMQLLDGTLLVRNVPPQAKRVLDAAGIGRLVTIQ